MSVEYSAVECERNREVCCAGIRGRFGLIDIHIMAIIKISHNHCKQIPPKCNFHSKNKWKMSILLSLFILLAKNTLSLRAMTTPTISEITRASRIKIFDDRTYYYYRYSSGVRPIGAMASLSK